METGLVAAFIGTSMLCGMAQNLEEMVLFRAAQGVAGAFIPPLSQSFMLDTARPSRHPQVMAIWGMGIMLGPILGPILGGWLTESANWRWVFYVNLPIGAISLAILMAELPERPATPRRFDLTGFVLIGLTLASFQLMLDRGTLLDWFDSPEIWLYTFVAISGLWLAVIHLASVRQPIFDSALFADRNFSFGVLATGVALAVQRNQLAQRRQAALQLPAHLPVFAQQQDPHADTGASYCACTHWRYEPLCTFVTHSGWSRYHCTVLRIPLSKVSAGFQPSSRSILRASMA
mgnify:CR=1 FL=1